jgi:NO-binding membrane sensor protein with MHYT domain
VIALPLTGLVVTTRDPRIDPGAGFVGAVLIGLAVGITAMPLFWLLAFARHRRIAYRGDWIRAIRRGAWIALIIAVLVVLRLQNLFQIPIALFIIAVVSVAEVMLSSER